MVAARRISLRLQISNVASSSAPSLLVDAYKESSDTATYDDVVLNTSSGVYLDPTTGNHWLFCPVVGSISVYPLSRQSAARHSGNTSYRTTRISQRNTDYSHDREHLGYILSRSLPWVKMNQPSTLTSTSAPKLDGVQRHWNWTGLVADIVNNETYDQGDGVNYGMRSTHFRMEMAQRMATGQPT